MPFLNGYKGHFDIIYRCLLAKIIMKDRNQAVRVFITREIPSSGIDLLRSEGFSVSVWQEDRPMTTAEMIAEGKSGSPTSPAKASMKAILTCGDHEHKNGILEVDGDETINTDN